MIFFEVFLLIFCSFFQEGLFFFLEISDPVVQLFRILEQLLFGLGSNICLLHTTQVNLVYQLIFLMLGFLQQFFELLPLFLLLLQLIYEHLHFLTVLFLFKDAHLPFELVVVFGKRFVGLSRRLELVFEGFEGSLEEIDLFSPL